MRDATGPVVPIDALGSIAQGIDHAEGICRTPDDTLYVSGERGQVYRIEDDGSAREVASTGGWTLGLAADGEGRILACDARRREVLRLDLRTSSWTRVSSGPQGAGFITPNWAAYAPDGSLFVSDSGSWKHADGRLVVVRPDGRTETWTTDSRDFPNGLAVTPDGSELWVLESTPGRLVSFSIRPDGTAGRRAVVADLEGHVPDGIAFASDGSAVIACYRPDVILQWLPGGQMRKLAEDPEGTALAAPTNVVFHGRDLDRISVPNIGRWHVTTFRLEGLRGVPLVYPPADQLGY